MITNFDFKNAPKEYDEETVDRAEALMKSFFTMPSPSTKPPKKALSGHFPNGSVFKRGSVFANGCTFGDDCAFAGDCHFGATCTFGNGCKFGHRCTFRMNCKFGDKNLFMPGCEFRKGNVFGYACVFRSKSQFDVGCEFGDRANFGFGCFFYHVSFGHKPYFGDHCIKIDDTGKYVRLEDKWVEVVYTREQYEGGDE